jgi:hypothetical protein
MTKLTKPKFHKSPDNYKSLMKYTACSHLRNNVISDNCQACDTAWLIERCRCLEKTIDLLKKEINLSTKL